MTARVILSEILLFTFGKYSVFGFEVMRLGPLVEFKMMTLYLDNWSNNKFDNAPALCAFKENPKIRSMNWIAFKVLKTCRIGRGSVFNNDEGMFVE